jgi:hypothetical protein
MNLVRLGHYFTPLGDAVNLGDLPSARGICRTALVTGHDNYGRAGDKDGVAVNGEAVHLYVWEHEGDPLGTREDVPVIPRPSEHPELDKASFHLSADCPWNR